MVLVPEVFMKIFIEIDKIYVTNPFHERKSQFEKLKGGSYYLLVKLG